MRWYGYLWRHVLALLVSAAVWGEAVQDQWNDHRGLFWLDLAVGVLCYAIVPLRRRLPMPIAVLTSALGAVSGLAAGPATWALVSLATRRVLWQLGVVGAISVAAGQVYATGGVLTVESGDHEAIYLVDLSVNTVVTVALLAWGMYVGSRRELLWTLRDQVRRAHEEQELRTREARTAERGRIAREMHDVLAHRISQVSMHANAVMFREDLSTEQMRQSVRIIQEKANEALVDLRSVLGVLRDPASGALLDQPQPTYDDLPGLVAEAREAGAEVVYRDSVAADGEVPEQAGRTVYRIVQEALTNARKHAPGAAVDVRLAGSCADGIDVRVSNPLGFGLPRAAGSGLGLVGLRERAELAGGRLEHRIDGTSFVLQAWIPCEA